MFNYAAYDSDSQRRILACWSDNRIGTPSYYRSTETFFVAFDKLCCRNYFIADRCAGGRAGAAVDDHRDQRSETGQRPADPDGIQPRTGCHDRLPVIQQCVDRESGFIDDIAGRRLYRQQGRSALPRGNRCVQPLRSHLPGLRRHKFARGPGQMEQSFRHGGHRLGLPHHPGPRFTPHFQLHAGNHPERSEDCGAIPRESDRAGPFVPGQGPPRCGRDRRFVDAGLRALSAGARDRRRVALYEHLPPEHQRLVGGRFGERRRADPEPLVPVARADRPDRAQQALPVRARVLAHAIPRRSSRLDGIRLAHVAGCRL